MEEICLCGHTRDEHKDSFFGPCEIRDCDCIAFEESDESESEDS